MGRGETHALRGAGIGTHEVVAGKPAAGELRRPMEKLLSGGLICIASPELIEQLGEILSEQ